MSIISEALNKVADKRKNFVMLQEEASKSLSSDIKKKAAKRTRWGILSSIGTFFIVGFAIVAFLHNAEYLPSFMPTQRVEPPSLTRPEVADITREPIEGIAVEEVSRLVISRPRSERDDPVLALTLNGLIGGPGEPLAVINNNILKKGDFVRGAQIIDIASDGVILLYDDKEIKLRMD